MLICEKDSRRMEQLKLNNLDLEPWQFIEDVFTIDQTLIDRVVNKILSRGPHRRITGMQTTLAEKCEPSERADGNRLCTDRENIRD